MRGALPTERAAGPAPYAGWANATDANALTSEVQRTLNARDLLLAFYLGELGPNTATGVPGLYDAESSTLDLLMLVDAAQLLLAAVNHAAKQTVTAHLFGSTYFTEYVVSLFNAFVAHPDATTVDLRVSLVRAIASGYPEPRFLVLGHVGSTLSVSLQNFVIDVFALVYFLRKYMGAHWARTSRAPTSVEEEDMFFQTMGVLDVLKDRARLSDMPPGLTAEMRRTARVPAPIRHGRTPAAVAAGPVAPTSPAAPAAPVAAKNDFRRDNRRAQGGGVQVQRPAQKPATKPGGKSAPS